MRDMDTVEYIDVEDMCEKIDEGNIIIIDVRGEVCLFVYKALLVYLSCESPSSKLKHDNTRTQKLTNVQMLARAVCIESAFFS